jgi:membrane-anchored protein YejM (alkaline phosphatase superfamily)
VSRAERRRDHLAWLTVQAMLAVVVFTVLGRGFLTGAERGTGVAGAYGLLALVSTGVLVALALAFVLAAPVAIASRDAVTFLVVPVVFAIMAFFVEADGVVFRLYRVHVNGMILDLLATPGGADSFTLGAGTWSSAAWLALATVGVHVGVSWLFLRTVARRTGASLARRAARIGLPALLAVMLFDKSVFAWAAFHGRADLTRVRRLVPLYRPVAMSAFLRQRLGLESRVAPAVETGGDLAYPRRPLEFQSHAPRWNVVVIAVEGLRWDMVVPSVMPFLAGWQLGQWRCEHNLSGGNASRFGLFSLLYGLDGTLWRTLRDEPSSPVLIEALEKRGYAFRILSGTDLNYPQFRQTAFRDLAAAITDRWPGDRVDRDVLQTEAAEAFVQGNRGPFFLFEFYDASHQPYLYPPEDAVFHPSLPPERLDYVRLANGHTDQIPLLFNRYRNSLHYVDRQIERLLSALERAGRLDDTIIVVCGDHGEEFGEGGWVGHNSAFDMWQLRTPLIVHLPGRAPRSIRRLTSHEDVPPTILEALGVMNPASDYSHGIPLTSETGPDRRVTASWDSAAVVGETEALVFGTEIGNLDVEVIDANGRPLVGREAAQRDDLVDVLQRMAQFRR